MPPPTANSPAPPTVRVIVGEDSFLRGEAIEAYRRRCQAPAKGDLNAEDYDLSRSGKDGQDPLEGLLEAARTLPMMAKVRWIHGSNLDALPAKAHPALLAYCQDPSRSTVLLLSCAKLDGRWKLSQALKALNAIETVEAPKPRELAGWVMQRARAAGVRLQPQAAAALASRVGGHFGLLANALETLHTFAGPSTAATPAPAVTAEDVVALVAPTRDAHVFELTAAMGRGEWAASSQLLGELLAGGESPLLVLAMLARQIRLLLAAKRWRGHARDFAEHASVRPFVAEGLLQDARRMEEGQLMNAMRAAQACDVALKTSALAPRTALERLLWVALAP